jgi:rod shape-determining protein MreC
MESFFVRFKNVLVLIAVLLAQTILLAVQVRRPDTLDEADGHKVLLLRSWVVAAVTPVEKLSHGIGKGIRGGWSDYIDLRSTRRKNQELQQEIARLRLEQAQFAEDAIQGRRLEALLAFREHYVTSTVAAQVIGTSGVDQSRVLYIDKGSADGLQPDMAVITPDGIVGKIRDVFPKTSPHTAQVLEINDPSSGAGVLLASTRIRALLRGAPDGQIQIGNLTQDSRIKPGEVVLTSGGDQIFPRGLKVGTIESIAPDPDHQPYTKIRIKPAANLTQLEEVLVITGVQEEMTPQAQQDLAAGVATAVEAKRAAELAAERLPSLSTNPDGSPAAPAPGTTAAGAATSPTASILNTPTPKPLPTLHPDRYTFGMTPPASSLTPGGHNAAPAAGTSPEQPEKTPRPSEGAVGDGPGGGAADNGVSDDTEPKPAPKKPTKPKPADGSNPQTSTPPKPPQPQPKEPQL